MCTVPVNFTLKSLNKTKFIFRKRGKYLNYITAKQSNLKIYFLSILSHVSSMLV